MDSKLRQVVYLSSAVRLMDEAGLLKLLEAARKSNEKNGITGVLLYSEGSFIQVLEGPPQAVEATLRRIRRDPRHQGYIQMLDRATDTRDFEGWYMGFHSLEPAALEKVAGYVSWKNGVTTRHKDSVASRIVESFRRSATLRQ